MNIHPSEKVVEKEGNSNELFPVFLKLNSLRLLLIGAGIVGKEKLLAVLGNSEQCDITIVAKEVSDDIRNIVAQCQNIKIIETAFDVSHLEHKDLVICAINDKAESERIRIICKQQGILSNFADKPELCDFYLGSIVKKGQVKIGISTNGKSPTLAKRIKEILNESFPDELSEVLENLTEIRSGIKGDINQKIKILNEATTAYKEKSKERSIKGRVIKAGIYSILVMLLMVAGHLIISQIPTINFRELYVDFTSSLDENFKWYFLGGLIAQLIDGALGMAYGVSVTTFLLSLGIPSITPAVASASMHASEVFNTGTASLVYMRYKNINMKLFKSLLIPGIIGAVLGAITVSYFSKENFQFIRPIVACYTLFLGALIIRKALVTGIKKGKKFKNFKPIAALGGFFDSVGGGGWGPIVTTSLIAGGRSLRYSIGSSHLTKFFVAIASTFTFFIVIGIEHWQIIFGLVIGGMLAAPFSIYLSTKIPTRPGLILVGVVVVILSIRNILSSIL
jgi:siroheme synthase-like protein